MDDDMQASAIGIRIQSGWGALVAVAGEPGALEVVERRRIEIVDRNAAGAAQPYHFAKDLELAEAKKFIANSGAASAQSALTAMREIVDELKGKAYNVVAAAILLSAGRPLPDLEKILGSHPMIHTTEGEFFRHAFRDACESLKIPVTGIRERELDDRTKSVLGKDAGSLKKKIAGLGKTLGPPWTSDQKTATLAAMIALAEQDNS